MSPEQVRGDVAGPASDVFALGCVLAFAATGPSPFGDDSVAMVMFRIVSEPPDLAGVSDAARAPSADRRMPGQDRRATGLA